MVAQSKTIVAAAAGVVLAGCALLGTGQRCEAQPDAAAHNVLTAEEKARGWILLFDGRTLQGWRGVGRDRVPEQHWIIEDGAVKKIPTKDVPLQADGQPLEGGDLMTTAAFDDFELSFEWKISPGGNSGVKYNVSEEMSLAWAPKGAALGFEYQILDDALHPDAKNGPHRTAAALYDLIPPMNKKLRAVGRFNSARIVFVGGRGEHWLNGAKVLEYDLGTPRMNELLAKSKYRDIAGFAEKRTGHIVLQDHTDEVWFRNIKLRPIKRFNAPATFAPIGVSQPREAATIRSGAIAPQVRARGCVPQRPGTGGSSRQFRRAP